MDNSINLPEILSQDGARLYFVGIGGIAMSAAANIARGFGYEVSGSDSQAVYAPAKDVLDNNRIEYFIGYDEQHIIDTKADLYIVSAGEGLQNSEVKYIVEHNLPRVGFAELLYELTKDSLRIVVAGTHGKSTTTGLLGHVLKNLDNSSFMAGAVLQNYQSNFSKGDGHYFVFEGDEYKEQFDDPTPKFHYYRPDILVLTNLEFDHPDQFGSLADLEREFGLLIEAMPPDGLIVYNADDANLPKLVHQSNIASVSFGVDNPADFKVEHVDFGPQFTMLSVKNKFSHKDIDELLGKAEDYQIQLPGHMNVYNSLAVIATLRALGFSRQNIALDLLSYKGVKRRFEIVGVKNGITIIDDYAHHSTAVRETLEAASARYFAKLSASPQAWGDAPSSTHEGQRGRHERQGKLWAIFEPHTFSRTKALLPDLAKSFDAADEVLISDIYPARESAKDASITSEGVVGAIRSNKLPLPLGEGRGEGLNNVRLVHNKQDAMTILKQEAKPGDVVVVMAVGSFNRLAYELKEML